MIKARKFVSIVIVLAVCLGLTLVPTALPGGVVSASSNVTIGVQPPTTNVDFSEAFSITVEVDNPDAVRISTAAARLNFNTTYFSVTSITAGPTLTTVLLNTYDNVAGTIDFDAGCPPGVNTTDTSILVCTINCLSKSVFGVSTVDFVYLGGPPPRQTKVEFGATDYLGGNTGLMNSGTVIVGEPPPVYVSPDSLAFNAIEAGENPPDQAIELCNSGAGALSWSLTDNAGWLSGTPTGGSLGEDECEDVTVSVDVTGMEAGDYSATITITGSPVLEIPVSLHIESATSVEPANLSASALSISPQQVEPGQEVTISINVANTGGETGSYNAVLYINEVVEDSQSVSVAAGASENVIFTVSKSQAGGYDVSLAGQSGQFEVVGGGGWVGGGGLGTGGIIAIVVAVIVLIVALFFILRGRRRET